MKSYLAILFILLIFTPKGWSQDHLSTQDSLKQAMIQDLNFIGNVFETAYAPALWKAEHIGWDLSQQISMAQSVIENSDTPTVDEYQILVRDFLRSTQDYHVGYGFRSTETARLGFTVKPAEGRYFIVYIDRKRLPKESFPFEVGYELLSFAGKPVNEAVEDILSETSMGVPGTDHELATLFLTSRHGARGMKVPQGRVLMSAQKVGDDSTQKTIQLSWEYTPEKIKNIQDIQKNNSLSFGGPSLILKTDLKNHMNSLQMTAGIWPHLKALKEDEKETQEEDKKPEPNPYYVGLKKGFLPEFGKKIWETADDSLIHAYIYRNGTGKIIGYLRIPTYMAGSAESKAIAEILKHFTDTTDALVIDQLNNPGGSVPYLYSLVSMLTDQALYTPRHHIKLTSEDIEFAYSLIDQLSQVRDPAELEALMGKEWGGYPVTMQTREHFLSFARFLISEWEKGKTLTDPIHISGIDRINPHVNVNYTKPILLLVNHLDFSGGDFFPAILQDNGRVTVMGTRTSGAGGFVTSMTYPNNFGLSFVSMTGSLARRIDNSPIENLGVTPDIEQPFTAKDLSENYVDYLESVNSQISEMLIDE